MPLATVSKSSPAVAVPSVARQLTRTSCCDGADNVTGTSTVVVPESPSVPVATPGKRSGWKIVSGMKVSSMSDRPKDPEADKELDVAAAVRADLGVPGPDEGIVPERQEVDDAGRLQLPDGERVQRSEARCRVELVGLRSRYELSWHRADELACCEARHVPGHGQLGCRRRVRVSVAETVIA